jgi:hypothetical protein
MDTKERYEEQSARHSSDQDIRLIAYELWLTEGCPHGRHVEHWLKAESIWRSGDEITKEDEITSAKEIAPAAVKSKPKTKPASPTTKPRRAKARSQPPEAH